MALDAAFGKNALATQFGVSGAYGALFTTAPSGGAPGTEVTGGTTPYARKPLTWSAPSNGVVSATATFNVPPCDVNGTGLFDALTAGNYVDGKTEATVTFTTDDTVTVTFTFTEV